MSIFKEVGLSWQGDEFIVPPDQVMGLVETIEEIITIEELSGKGVKRAKVAKAFAAALRYAGARKVDEQDVYDSMFGVDAMTTTTQTVYALLSLMIPPEHLQAKPQKPAKTPATRNPKSATGSSRKRTS